MPGWRLSAEHHLPAGLSTGASSSCLAALPDGGLAAVAGICMLEAQLSTFSRLVCVSVCERVCMCVCVCLCTYMCSVARVSYVTLLFNL